jgi:hypothetical protein
VIPEIRDTRLFPPGVSTHWHELIVANPHKYEYGCRDLASPHGGQ